MKTCIIVNTSQPDNIHYNAIWIFRLDDGLCVIVVIRFELKRRIDSTRAKSTLDAGWSIFKTVLEYKCNYAGVVFEVVNETWSTQMCSSCGSVEGPKGREELDARKWTRSCGAHHDRDVNAALNISAKGLAQMAISKAAEAKADEPALNKDSGALGSMAEVGHDLPAGGITVL